MVSQSHQLCNAGIKESSVCDSWCNADSRSATCHRCLSYQTASTNMALPTSSTSGCVRLSESQSQLKHMLIPHSWTGRALIGKCIWICLFIFCRLAATQEETNFNRCLLPRLNRATQHFQTKEGQWWVQAQRMESRIFNTPSQVIFQSR